MKVAKSAVHRWQSKCTMLTYNWSFQKITKAKSLTAVRLELRVCEPRAFEGLGVKKIGDMLFRVQFMHKHSKFKEILSNRVTKTPFTLVASAISRIN